MATVIQKLGAKIKKLRTQRGLTQEKLAELAKIDYSFLNLVESGKKNISIKRLAKLARVLGVKLRDLVP